MKKLLTSFFIVWLLAAGAAEAAITPNDPHYGQEWYIGKIKADSAWEKISASPDIVIAVIDSGIDINHPDLRDNIWHNQRETAGNKIDDDQNGFIDDAVGWDFVIDTADPAPKFSAGWTEAGVSHGTMVAGVMAARGNNGLGVAGVTWRAQIMPLKALNDKGEGKINDVIRAIDYAISNGADIINLSFVSFNYSEALQEAIRRAHDAGVIVVAAAGNEQAAGVGYDIDKTPVYPACYDGNFGENMVIGVAATDALDQKAKFSSYGSRCVDISAPGISFFSTVTAGSVSADPSRIYDGYWSGTSLAAPSVSATLALIMQANPELSQREVVNILFAATDNISRLNPDYPDQLGNGRLNVNRAVELAKDRLYSRLGRLVVSRVNGNETKLTAADGDGAGKLSIINFKVGSLAAGDINGDGAEEIIIGAAAGAEPRVRIFSAAGKLVKDWLAFDRGFRGGVNVAVGDLDGDDKPEIVAAAASRGNGQVRIFDTAGKLKNQFLVDRSSWRGGLTLAVGNVDGRGAAEIVAGYGAGSEPQVRIFTAGGKLVSVFLAYEKSFRGGVKVAAANRDGRRDRNKAEIIVAPGPGREPLVKIFDNRAVLQKKFLAYGSSWRGGMNLAAGDLNNDGRAEIAVGASPGATPHVRVFGVSGELLDSFYAWEAGWSGGVNVGIIKVSN
jgi:subtilisin family serine protease